MALQTMTLTRDEAGEQGNMREFLHALNFDQQHFQSQLLVHRKPAAGNLPTVELVFLHHPQDPSPKGGPPEHTSDAGSRQSERKDEGQQVVAEQRSCTFKGTTTADGILMRGNIFDDSARDKPTNHLRQHPNFHGGHVTINKGAVKEGNFYLGSPSGTPGKVVQGGGTFETENIVQEGSIFQGNSYVHCGNPGSVFQDGGIFTGQNTTQDGHVFQGNFAGAHKVDVNMF